MGAALHAGLRRVAMQQLPSGGDVAHDGDGVDIGGGELRVGLEQRPRAGPPSGIVLAVVQAGQPEELIDQLPADR